MFGIHINNCSVLLKAIPLKAWRGPEGSRSLRLPDFKTTLKGDKVVSLHTCRLYLPGNIPVYSFLLEAESTAKP